MAFSVKQIEGAIEAVSALVEKAEPGFDREQHAATLAELRKMREEVLLAEEIAAVNAKYPGVRLLPIK